MYLTEYDEIREFLNEAGEQSTLKSYEKLTDTYGLTMESTLQTTESEGESHYTLTVDCPSRRKANEKAQKLSETVGFLQIPDIKKLLGLTWDWPREFTGAVSVDDVPPEYRAHE